MQENTGTLGVVESYVEFEKKINDILATCAPEIEQFRILTLRKINFVKCFYYSPFISILLAISSMFLASKNDIFYVLMFVFLAFYYLCLYSLDFITNYCDKKRKEYKRFANKYFNLNKIFERMNVRKLHESPLLRNGYVETAFSVNYEGYEFIILETVVSAIHNLEVRFPFNKNIRTEVIINEDSLVNTSGILSKPLSLESDEFNGEFTVYASDEVEARYLISTAFMERLLKVKKTFNLKDFRAEFLKDKNELVIEATVGNSSDLFEFLDIEKSIYDLTMFSKFYFEIASLKNLAKYLKLNLNIGL